MSRSFVDTSVVPIQSGNRGARLWEQAIGMKLPILWGNKEGRYVTLISYDKESQKVILDYQGHTYSVDKQHVHSYLPVAVSEPDLCKGLPSDVIWIEPRSSRKRVQCTCLYCGGSMGYLRLGNYIKNWKGICPYCKDGFSYPSKFVMSVINQLRKTYDVFVQPEKVFDWCRFILSDGTERTGRYDIYLIYNNCQYIIEVDGGWHTSDNCFSGQTKETSYEIDQHKDRLALEHNIEIIRIPCPKSIGHRIQDEILKSRLNEIFDLSIIDWEQCEYDSTSSIRPKIVELWNEGKSSGKIAKQLNVSKSAIHDTLNIMQKNGVIANYVPDVIEQRRIRDLRITQAKLKIKRQRSVIRINDGEVWKSVEDCSKNIGICKAVVRDTCRFHKILPFKFKDEPMYLMYEDEYKEKGNLCELYLLYRDGWIGDLEDATNPTSKKCVCLNNPKLKFLSAKAAGKYYKVNTASVAAVVAGRYHKTENNLVFVEYEKFLTMGDQEKRYLLDTDFQYRPTKKIILLNTMERFDSELEAAQRYNLSRATVGNCLNHNKEFGGFDSLTKEGYVWILEQEYKEGMIIPLRYNPRFPPVICVEDCKIFWCPNSAKAFYGLRKDAHKKFIEYYCNGNGGLYDEKHWMYLKDYFELHPEIINQIAFYREHIYLEQNRT